jgi:hypothetical protein
MHTTRLAIASLIVLIGACSKTDQPAAEGSTAASETVPAEALAAIDTATLMQHIRVLSHDSLLGRQPGPPGEEKTIAYLDTLQDQTNKGTLPGVGADAAADDPYAPKDSLRQAVAAYRMVFGEPPPLKSKQGQAFAKAPLEQLTNEDEMAGYDIRWGDRPAGYVVSENPYDGTAPDDEEAEAEPVNTPEEDDMGRMDGMGY